jgi:hypothetical protein
MIVPAVSPVAMDFERRFAERRAGAEAQPEESRSMPERRPLKFLAKKPLSRRSVPKGAGVSSALPFLDAIGVGTPLARTTSAPKPRRLLLHSPRRPT